MGKRMREGVKKILGFFMIILAPLVVVLMCWVGISRTFEAPPGIIRINIGLQWGSILFIFIPICFGLLLFGLYALKGEYKQEEE